MLLNPAALFMGMAASALLLQQSHRRRMESTATAEPLTERQRYSARVRLLKRINAGYRPQPEPPRDVYRGSFRARKLTWREWVSIAWAGLFR